jgi:hypothetical protein
MPTYRSVLLNALNTFATNSLMGRDGYDWAEIYDDDRPFDEMTDAELYNLLIHYIAYMKGE